MFTERQTAVMADEDIEEFIFSPEDLMARLATPEHTGLPSGVDPEMLRELAVRSADTYLAKEIEPHLDLEADDIYQPVIEFAPDLEPAASSPLRPYVYVDITSDPEDLTHFQAAGYWINGGIHSEIHVVMVGEYGGMSADMANGLIDAIKNDDRDTLLTYANAALRSPSAETAADAQPIFKTMSIEHPYSIDNLGQLVSRWLPESKKDPNEPTLEEMVALAKARNAASTPSSSG